RQHTVAALVGPWAALDPAAAERLRDVEGAVEDDLDHGIEAAGRQILARAQEVAGRVVDHVGDRAELGLERIESGVDPLALAHVGAGPRCGAAELRDLGRDRLQRLDAATEQRNLGPELGAAQRHGLAESGASTGDEDRVSVESVAAEHGRDDTQTQAQTSGRPPWKSTLWPAAAY